MCAKAISGHYIGMPYSDVPVKVFLADDSALIRARVAVMLAAPAMTIVGQAETPQACIEGILATKPHVVVLDVQLDGGQGLDVLRAIRPADPDIAFVVFSNNSGVALPTAARIRFPVSVEHLRAAVTKRMDTTRIGSP